MYIQQSRKWFYKYSEQYFFLPPLQVVLIQILYFEASYLLHIAVYSQFNFLKSMQEVHLEYYERVEKIAFGNVSISSIILGLKGSQLNIQKQKKMQKKNRYLQTMSYAIHFQKCTYKQNNNNEKIIDNNQNTSTPLARCYILQQKNYFFSFLLQVIFFLYFHYYTTKYIFSSSSKT